MDPATRPARRKLAVCFLLVLSVIGAVMRLIAPADSWTHTLGTLFMLMWLPIVGTVVFWFARKRAPLVPVPQGFSDDEPFVAHVVADLDWASDAGADLPPTPGGCRDCMFVLGADGFTARIRAAAESEPRLNQPLRVAAQFRSPRVALPRFLPGTVFAAWRGKQLLAQGRIPSVPAEP